MVSQVRIRTQQSFRHLQVLQVLASRFRGTSNHTPTGANVGTVCAGRCQHCHCAHDIYVFGTVEQGVHVSGGWVGVASWLSQDIHILGVLPVYFLPPGNRGAFFWLSSMDRTKLNCSQGLSKKSIISTSVSVMCVWAHVPLSMCGGQMTTL